MRAARYMRGGVAADVLTVVEEPRPEPGPGEVRVRLAFSGVNPGDTKKRADWQGLGLPFPLVIPCHRVVRAGGHLGGFGGGPAMKQALLALEGVEIGETGRVVDRAG